MNLYVRTHTTSTEIFPLLKDSMVIDHHVGWSHYGNTRQKYQHYYADNAFDALLTLTDGLMPITPGGRKQEEDILEQSDASTVTR